MRLILLVTSLAFAISVYAECKPTGVAAQALIKVGAHISESKQTDFSRLNTSATCYLEAWPDTTQMTAALVKAAYRHNIPIRTQGGAHSQNGSSLPQKFELLIHTQKLNQVIFTNDNTVVAGSGIAIETLNQYLIEKTSFILPVVNGGGAGPTIGGFISAGGLSFSSRKNGGFWDNVRAITLVTGNGRVLHLQKDNPQFIWLFGAFGQLGIITEAELDLFPAENIRMNAAPLSAALNTRLAPAEMNAGTHWIKATDEHPLAWFNIFVTANKTAEAYDDLAELRKKYPLAMTHIGRYEWPVAHFGQTPPLLFEANSDFSAVGMAGTPGKSKESREQLSQLEKDFTALVNKKHYQRYIQAELAKSPDTYKQYFSPSVYTQFRQIKVSLDPKFLFNQGSFFN